MKFNAFVGPSYVNYSKNAECEECINFFIEEIETVQGKNRYILIKRPGYRELFQAGLHITALCPTEQPVLNEEYSYTLTASGGVEPYTWTVIAGALPTGLTLDPDTGIISGIATVAGTYSWTIRVTDANGATSDISCAQTVLPGLTITYDEFVLDTCGGEYTNTPIVDGTPPYTFEILSGALPDGLTLDTATGAISGIATTEEEWEAVIKVTDLLGNVGQVTIGGTVGPCFFIDACPLETPTVGVEFSFTFTATGGTPPYIWELLDGPGAIDPDTGEWTWTPTNTDTINITVQVTDSDSPPLVATITCALTPEEPVGEIFADVIYSESSPRIASHGDNASRYFFALHPSRDKIYSSVFDHDTNTWQVWVETALPAGLPNRFGASSSNQQTMLFCDDANIITKALLAGADPDRYIDQPWVKYAISDPLAGGGTICGPNDPFWDPTAPSPFPPTALVGGTTAYSGKSTGADTGGYPITLDIWGDETNTLPLGYVWNRIGGSIGTGTGTYRQYVFLFGVGDKVGTWFQPAVAWALTDCPDGDWREYAQFDDALVAVGVGTNQIMKSEDFGTTWELVTGLPVGWVATNPRVVWTPSITEATTQGTFFVIGGTPGQANDVLYLKLGNDDVISAPFEASTPALGGSEANRGIAKSIVSEGIVIIRTDGSDISFITNPEGGDNYDDWTAKTKLEAPF